MSHSVWANIQRQSEREYTRRKSDGMGVFEETEFHVRKILQFLKYRVINLFSIREIDRDFDLRNWLFHKQLVSLVHVWFEEKRGKEDDETSSLGSTYT